MISLRMTFNRQCQTVLKTNQKDTLIYSYIIHFANICFKMEVMKTKGFPTRAKQTSNNVTLMWQYSA